MTDRALVPCHNFQALEPGIRALVEIHPDITEDSWWMRVGLREVVPYVTIENDRRVGFCFLTTGEENGPLILVAGLWASTVQDDYWSLPYGDAWARIRTLRGFMDLIKDKAAAEGCVDVQGHPRVRMISKRPYWKRLGFKETAVIYEHSQGD